MLKRLRVWVVAGGIAGAPFWVAAQPSTIAAALNEEVLTIPRKVALFTLEIETTVFRPDGPGPFPLVVINHGKQAGDPRHQNRYRPLSAARFFLARGYAVLVPMRTGFSKSTGQYIGAGCNIESNGRVQAEDVRTVLEWAGAQPWADRSRVLVVGQSHGGWTSLALGTFNDPGVVGIVNFAGGLRQTQCPGWEGGLARAAATYGEKTRIPSLWFYGDNDSFFSPSTWRPMFERYRAGNPWSELVAFGTFRQDAHGMFGSRAGESIWQPPMTEFMTRIGLPTEVVQPRFAAATASRALPPASGHARIGEIDAVPCQSDRCRDGYRTFLEKSSPRAFASNGRAWGWASGGADPAERALQTCAKSASGGTCRLYAVDDRVVWEPAP
jgi:dienelactone hydrolase